MIILTYTVLVIIGLVLFIGEYYLIRDTMLLTDIDVKCKKLAKKSCATDVTTKK